MHGWVEPARRGPPPVRAPASGSGFSAGVRRMLLIALPFATVGAVASPAGDDAARSILSSAERVEAIVAAPANLAIVFPELDCGDEESEDDDAPFAIDLLTESEETPCERRERERKQERKKIRRKYRGDPTGEIVEKVVVALRGSGAMRNIVLVEPSETPEDEDGRSESTSPVPRLEFVTDRLGLEYYPLTHDRFRLVLRTRVRLLAPGARKPSWEDRCLVDLKKPKGERSKIEDFYARRGRRLNRSLDKAVAECTDQLVRRLRTLMSP